MEKLAHFLLKHKVSVICCFVVAVVVSLALLPLVSINYDLTAYLPDESMSIRSIAVLEKEFSYPGMADVMLSNVTLEQALAAKQKIAALDGVKSVLWLDDLVDINTPQEYLDSGTVQQYYKDNSALFTLEFTEGNYHKTTGAAIDQIRSLYGENVSVRGMAEDARNMQNSLMNEILQIILIVFPICVFILMLASKSWIEPLLYLIVIGVSIAINLGTNALFDSISYLTFSVCAVLQMAISMDYSLFLSHRYMEEKDSGKSIAEAMAVAVKGSAPAIFASSFTTFAGFMALLFMGYTIGSDLGIVLAKGIILSFITVMLLLPILLVVFNKAIDKTRHRPLIPPFTKLAKVVMKLRYPLLIIAILITVPAILGQQQTSYIYGDSSASSATGLTAEDKAKMNEKFGVSNPIILVTPLDSMANETKLAEALQQQEYVKNVTCLATIAPPALPLEMLPQAVVDQFHSPQHSRFIVNLTVDGENAPSFAAAEEIKQVLEQAYPDKWLAAGSIMSIVDIKQTVENDSLKVSLISLIAIAFIILITFKSWILPLILVLVIQSSVWINMSFPYFTDKPLIFIGYLIVSAIQLGATIDYGILLSSRFMEYRKTHAKKEALLLSIEKAGASIMVSALILAVAGFTLGMVSQMQAVADIGILLGRGALLSGGMVLFVLPAFLMIFDRLIQFTTVKSGRGIKAEKVNKGVTK